MPQPKTKKPGRPKLPKGAAKGKAVQVRFAFDEYKRLSAAAEARKQTVSEFIRGTLSAAMESA
jgi:uncharacterized protein (DUF1778 family)